MKNKKIHFQFANNQNKLVYCFTAGKPSFYIPQVVGKWNGFILSDKESAQALKQISEAAIKHFESNDSRIKND